MKSKLGSLGIADWGKGLLLAVLTTICTMVLVPLTTPPMHFPTASEWGVIGIAALSTLVSYILKQLGTNSEGKLLKKEAE